MKLIFVRHGQTDYNLEGRPQGQEMDRSLNETGIQQVEEAAQYVPEDIDFIISSPLKRAAQTAEILNRKLKKEVIYNNDIKELRYGSLAGKLWSDIEVETGDNDIRQKDHELLFDYHQYGGDSAADLQHRVEKFIEETKAKYPDKKILVTTHGGVVDTMHKLYTQDAVVGAQNATVHEFTF
jgi:broad specificity phosphatase PhoE